MKINAIGQLVKTNPIQTQSNPVLSAVEWANFFKAQNRLPENPATPGRGTLDLTKDKWYRVIVACTCAYLHR